MGKFVKHIYLNACIMLFMLALTLVGRPVCAQTNALGIHDELYEMYRQTYATLSKPEGLENAKKMLNRAKELGDNKAECFALGITIEHYGRAGDISAMAKAADNLRVRANELKMRKYYYDAYLTETKYYIKGGRTLDAFQAINTMAKEAETEGYAYGTFYSKVMRGHVYQARNNPASALSIYQEAFLIVEDHPDELTVDAELYANVVNCLINLSRYDEALLYIKKGLAMERIRRSTVSHFMASECKCHYLTNQRDTFLVKYAEYKEYKSKNDPETHTSEENDAEVYKAIIDGRYEDAAELTQRFGTRLDKANNMQIIYRAKKDFVTAYKYLDTIRQEYQKLFDNSFNEDISSMNATLEHEQMKQRNKDLEIERNKQALLNKQLLNEKKKLMLNRTELQLNNASETFELQQAKLANRDLEIENREISLKNQKLALQHQQEMIEYEEKQQERQTRLGIAIIICLALVAIGIIIFILLRERNIKRLHETNDNLQVARHKAIESQMKAEKSEKMKSSFIQNMSHEIRTPLNAICGFSQILADEDTQSALSQEQREDLSKIISENTDLLTNLVNDILYISDLESGKYKMKYEKTPVNEICRMAIKEVINKKREGVDINFATNIESDRMLYTDKIRSAQVLINLLNNAIKRTEKGEICLYSLQDQEKGYVVFAVTDTGGEIPADKAEIIFDRFEKVETRDNGTGLGLSICKLIAEKEGGWVKLDTTYKGGAKFIFAHPAV